MSNKRRISLHFSTLIILIAVMLLGILSVPAMASYQRQEIVFIDAGVKEPQILAERVPAGTEVIYLDAGHDGIRQIAETLTGRHAIDAIHIISHGEVGKLFLGDAILSSSNVSKYTNELKTIGASMKQDGELLIYGCETARGTAGKAFIESLSKAAGISVAGSNDNTSGDPSKGNSVLEVSTGATKAQTIDLSGWNEILGNVSKTVGIGSEVTLTSSDLGYESYPYIYFASMPGAGSNLGIGSASNHIGAGYCYSKTDIIDAGMIKFQSYTPGTYSFQVRWTSGMNLIENPPIGPMTNLFTITITVTNPTPTDIILSNSNAPAGYTGLRIGKLTGLDNYSDTNTFSIISDPSNLFTISGADSASRTAMLSFQTGKTLANGVSATVGIRVTDSANNTYDKTLTITGAVPTIINVQSSTSYNYTYTGSGVTDVNYYMPPETGKGQLNTWDAWGMYGSDIDVGTAISDESGIFDNDPLIYVAPAALGQDSYALDNVYYIVNITSPNTSPSMSKNTGLSLNEDTTATTIDNTKLQATDIEQAAAALTYTIGTAPSKGTLKKGSTTLTASSTFTQADIDSNSITYTPAANQNGTDSFTFTVSDGAGGSTASTTFTLSISPSNDNPTDINLSSSSVAENTPSGNSVGMLSTTDPDSGDTFTYTFATGTGDTDNSSFSINGNSLKLAVTPDYEIKNSYTIRIRSTDAGGLFTEKQFTITITNVNETPTDINLSSSTVNENTASGSIIGTLSTTDVDAADTFTYALVTGVGAGDNASFTISGNSLRLAVTPDYETKNSYAIRIRSTDAGGLYTEKQFTITIANVNDAPTNIALSNASVAEGTASGSTVGSFTTTDQDIGDTFTYSFVTGTGDTDNNYFTLSGNALKLAFIPDFETKSTYSIRVRTTDSGTGSLYYEKQLTITITNVNETPTNISLSNSTVNENTVSGTSIGTLTTTDVDAGDTFTYTLITGTGDTDNACFTIAGNSLMLAVTPDYEAKSSYTVRIRSTDAGGLYTEKQYTIAITNVNDTPSNITLSNASIAEGSSSGSTIGAFTTADQDTGETFTYTLATGTGDTDNGCFTIDGNSLKLSVVPDFETKASYSIRVRSTDSGAGSLFFEKQFTIAVTNVNEAPTDISLSTYSVAENTLSESTIATLNTADIDSGDTFTYALVAGDGDTDNTSFSITGNSLRLAVSPDYETKNSYSVRIRSTDAGGLTTEKQITIAISNVNDTPANITLSADTAAENTVSGSTVGTFTTTDQDTGDSFTYSLVAGEGSDDNGSFTVAGNALKLSVTPDYETKSSYTVRIRSTDAGGIYTEKQFTIAITDVNEAPTDISLSNNSAAENSESGYIIGTFGSTDSDAGDSFTYAFVTGIGSDNNTSFTITGNSLKLNVVPDYETKSSYTIRVRSTDAGGLYTEKQMTVEITNVNETPSDISLSNSNAAENSPLGTSVGTLSTTDVDAGDTFTYTLVTGVADNDSFSINGSNLTLAVIPDYETKNSYSVRIRSTDAGGLYTEKQFTISITNVNDAPSDIALSTESVAEKTTSGSTVGTLTTADQDQGDTFTYTLVTGIGSGDNNSFVISGNTLKLAVTPDYEAKNSYSVRIRSTDAGGLYIEKTVTITVTNVNDNPTDIALSTDSIAENTTPGSIAATFTTIDQDTADEFTYTLAAGAGDSDNASFTINGNALELAVTPDYETKNSYTVRIRSTDTGGLYTEKQFILTITNNNDTPSDITLTGGSVAENTTSGAIVGTFTTADQDAGDFFTYTLATGSGDADNASFTISGNSVELTVSPDYEVKHSYGIRVRSTDVGGLYTEKQFTITITDVNDSPTDMALSVSSVVENTTSGAIVGTFTTTDQDAGDSFTYTFATGSGDNDNASFTITGNSLKLAVTPDYETKSSYTIRLRSTDAGGLYTEKQFAVNIDDVNELLLPANQVKNGTEDTVMSFGAEDFVYADPDGDSLDKIKVMSLPSNGKLKLGGTDITVSQEIDKTELGDITFVPDVNWNGTNNFTWKGNDGTEWSAQTGTATLVAAPVNDIPVAENANISTDVNTSQNGILSATDVDNDTLFYSVSTQGTKGTLTITDPASGAFTYTPNANVTGSDTVTYRVYDQTEYSTIATVNINILPSNNADLAGISAGGVTLSPAFSSSQTSYTASVDSTIASTTITPAKSESNSVVKINGKVVADSTVIDLSFGENTIIIEVTAQDNVSKKTYTIRITKSSPQKKDSNEVAVQINGKTENAGTAVTTVSDGKTVTTVTLDTAKIEEKLSQEGNNTVLTIPVTNKSDVVVGELNGQIVKNMEAKEAVVEVKTENVTYVLPAAQINIDNVSQQIGEKVQLQDIKVSITVAAPPENTVQVVQDTANKNSYQIVVKPVEFNITCTNGEKTVEVSKFNGYVERTIAIPEGIDPSKITTGIVLNADGTFSHVPTTIIVIEGKYFAKINSLTNSTYSVIYSPKSFVDAENHWAKADINDMASRLVVDGDGDGTFQPDRNITRAEFVTILVKALGLKPGTGRNPFTDVSNSEWYAGYIKTAYEYKLISGYSENTFGPMDTITREQAMTMLRGAMKLTKLEVELTNVEVEKLIAGFTDGSQTSDWSRNSVAACVKAGIISGRTGNMAAPEDNITRAEVAVMIRRLLQKSNLI